jgi:hypothetical protein
MLNYKRLPLFFACIVLLGVAGCTTNQNVLLVNHKLSPMDNTEYIRRLSEEGLPYTFASGQLRVPAARREECLRVLQPFLKRHLIPEATDVKAAGLPPAVESRRVLELELIEQLRQYSNAGDPYVRLLDGADNVLPSAAGFKCTAVVMDAQHQSARRLVEWDEVPPPTVIIGSATPAKDRFTTALRTGCEQIVGADNCIVLTQVKGTRREVVVLLRNEADQKKKPELENSLRASFHANGGAPRANEVMIIAILDPLQRFVKY